jgi:hypothetical protein
LALKQVFDEATNNELVWDDDFITDSGKSIVRVYVKKRGVTINNKENWPVIFSFFYEKMSVMENVFIEYKLFLDES